MRSEKPYWPPYRRPNQPMPKLGVTRAEIAEHFGLSRSAVDDWAAKGRMPAPIGSVRPVGRIRPVCIYDLQQVIDMRGAR